MIGFLLDEGVITVGVLSGIFTTALLNSFKSNIIDPSIEKLVPSYKLDKTEDFASLFPLPIGKEEDPKHKHIIKWQTFLKDFFVWFLLMFMLYLFWKFVIFPRKANKMGFK